MLEHDQAAWTIGQMSGAYATGRSWPWHGPGIMFQTKGHVQREGRGLLGERENSDYGWSASRGGGEARPHSKSRGSCLEVLG